MNLKQYKPLNTREAIDKLINDLKSGKLKYSSSKQMEINCLYEIRKIKLQLYFKEKIAENSDFKNSLNPNFGNDKTLSDANKLSQKTKKKKQFYKGQKILILDNSENKGNINNECLETKKKKRKKRKEITFPEIVEHKKYFVMTILELANEMKWKPKVILTILQHHGIRKSLEEKLSFEEYSLVKEIINHRIIQLQRQKKREKWILESRVKRKSEKPRYSVKRSGVFDEIAKYGLGKLIYIRSK